MSVTDVSSRIILPGTDGTAIIVRNNGDNKVYFRLTDASGVAVLTDFPLDYNCAVGVQKTTETYIAAICDSGKTATLSVTVGTGQLDTVSVYNSSNTNFTLASAIPAGENFIGKVGSSSSVVGVEFGRPSDTNAYLAKDVITTSTSAGSLIIFTDLVRVNAGSAWITRARIMTDNKDCVAQLRLHLFHASPTVINDNVPYGMLYANYATRIGSIDFPALATEDYSTSTGSATMRPSYDGSYPEVGIHFAAGVGSKTIYGILETLTAFTPTSGQRFYVELRVVND
jgi:hypothetical protein